MNIDPATTKYLIRAKITADGVVEKPDVVGAIFGQTEGLLGDELDMRDLQKTGRMGRIEVDVDSNKGKSEGSIIIPSSLDQVETAILASALETIDRIGPCKANVGIDSIEDVRVAKRNMIIERAKELLGDVLKQSKNAGVDLTESVRQAVQIQEIISYGTDKCAAGPNIPNSDSIIIVEGRSDVLNLLKYGIKNVICTGGTNVPGTIRKLTSERIATAFVDGDRGGELILRELIQVSEIDFIAQAPGGNEVEELTQKQVIKALRNKIPTEQFIEMHSIDMKEKQNIKETIGQKRDIKPVKRMDSKPSLKNKSKHGLMSLIRPKPDKDTKPREVPQRVKPTLSETQKKYKEILISLSGTLKANLLDSENKIVKEVPVRELPETLTTLDNVDTVVFDGVITQRLLDISYDRKIKTIVGVKIGNITKQPDSLEVLTKQNFT